MHIIMGASGQVGSMVADRLLTKGIPVKAVVRDAAKIDMLKKKGAAIAIADALDAPALTKAFQQGTSILMITPEPPDSNDVLEHTRRIISNYRSAITANGIKKIVGLSSLGAQFSQNSGNLKMSYMLEHAFKEMDLRQIFVRPAYYYSNWLSSLPGVKENGTLTTFFPADLKMPMCSPRYIAGFISQVMVEDQQSCTYEIEGPEWYSASDIASAFEEVLGRQVTVQSIPEEKWFQTLKTWGLSDDAAQNFLEMIQVVASGKSISEGTGTIPVKVPTTFRTYLYDTVNKDTHRPEPSPVVAEHHKGAAG